VRELKKKKNYLFKDIIFRKKYLENKIKLRLVKEIVLTDLMGTSKFP